VRIPINVDWASPNEETGDKIHLTKLSELRAKDDDKISMHRVERTRKIEGFLLIK
jgi:hypothetical protein